MTNGLEKKCLPQNYKIKKDKRDFAKYYIHHYRQKGHMEHLIYPVPHRDFAKEGLHHFLHRTSLSKPQLYSRLSC